jgi:hypothetical protein
VNSKRHFSVMTASIGLAVASLLVGRSAHATSTCGTWESVSTTTQGTTWSPTGDICETGNPDDPTTLSEVEFGVSINQPNPEMNEQEANLLIWDYAEFNDTTGYWVELWAECNGSWVEGSELGPFTTQLSPGTHTITGIPCTGTISEAIAWVWTN